MYVHVRVRVRLSVSVLAWLGLAWLACPDNVYIRVIAMRLTQRERERAYMSEREVSRSRDLEKSREWSKVK